MSGASPWIVGWASTAALLAGCGSGDPVAASPSAPERDAGSVAVGPKPAGAFVSAHGTFATARKVTVGDFPGELGVVEGREDTDFYSFEGTEGQWVTVRSTETSALSISDTALTLYAPDHQLLASNRYVRSLQGEHALARIVTRLPRAGTYYVSVGDRRASSVTAGLVQPYRLSVVDLASAEGYAVNAESGSDAAGATRVAFRTRTLPADTLDESFFAGDFSSAADVDVFAFDVAPGKARLLNAQVDAPGAAGNGSTSPVGLVWITDASATHVIGRIDNGAGQTMLSPPLDAGSYLLWVAHPQTDPGTNDFYVIRSLVVTDNPNEAADATNGVVGTAEPLTNELQGSAGEQRLAYLVAHLGDADVDYFRFDGQAGQSGTVYCSSSGDGSGVVDLHIAARDASDATLAEDVETATKPVSLDNIPIPATGSFFLRAWKTSQLSDVSGNWVRCAISSQ